MVLSFMKPRSLNSSYQRFGRKYTTSIFKPMEMLNPIPTVNTLILTLLLQVVCRYIPESLECVTAQKNNTVTFAEARPSSLTYLKTMCMQYRRNIKFYFSITDAHHTKVSGLIVYPCHTASLQKAVVDSTNNLVSLSTVIKPNYHHFFKFLTLLIQPKIKTHYCTLSCHSTLPHSNPLTFIHILSSRLLLNFPSDSSAKHIFSIILSFIFLTLH